MSGNYERYGGYTSGGSHEEDEAFSLGEFLRRHYVATRVVVAELFLFGLAGTIVLNTDGPLDNVVFGMLVSIGIMFGAAVGLFGAMSWVQRWRRG